MVKTLSDGPEQSKEGDNGGGSRRRMRQVTDKGWQVLVHKQVAMESTSYTLNTELRVEGRNNYIQKYTLSLGSHIGWGLHGP